MAKGTHDMEWERSPALVICQRHLSWSRSFLFSSQGFSEPKTERLAAYPWWDQEYLEITRCSTPAGWWWLIICNQFLIWWVLRINWEMINIAIIPRKINKLLETGRTQEHKSTHIEPSVALCGLAGSTILGPPAYWWSLNRCYLLVVVFHFGSKCGLQDFGKFTFE